MDDDEIDLSKLYSFKNKFSRPSGLKFKKEDFILPDAFSWTNIVVLYNIDAPNNLKTIFESTTTILEKAGKVPAPVNTQFVPSILK